MSKFMRVPQMRSVRVTRQGRYALAGSGKRYAPAPVTILYPDGRKVVQVQERKHKPKSKRSKSKSKRVAGAIRTQPTTTRLTASERRAQEWAILNSVASDNLIMVDGELVLR